MSVRMTEEEYRKIQSEKAEDEARQLTAEDLGGPAQQYDEAVAIDPGQECGLAWTNGARTLAWTSSFWQIVGDEPFAKRPLEDEFDVGFDPDEVAVLLEAPFLSRPGMAAGNTAKAYNSGRVAREAELIDAGLSAKGFDVYRFDPAKYKGGKWDHRTAEHFVGQWDGPSNDHIRDAIRLLVFYNFV